MTADIVVAVLVGIGWLFSLSGVLGVVRMPDVYSRVQYSTKTITMGALPALVALVVAEGPITPYGARALLVLFLFGVVNPAASHALLRAAYKSGVPQWDGAVRDEPRERAGRGARP